MFPEQAVRYEISIHALREEGDSPAFCGEGKADVFLSTPSARRATLRKSGRASNTQISIHALREEGDKRKDWATRMELISIHALREEGDYHPGALRPRRTISIHALREEGDQDIPLVPLIDDNFYPRPPRGGRLGCPAFRPDA